LVINTFHETLKEFYYPPIPEPEIVWNRFDKDLIKIKHGKWGFLINISATPKIPESALRRFYRALFRKMIAYYVVCPFDIDMATKILVNAVQASDEKIGKLATNLLIELVNIAYLSRIYRDDMIWFHKAIFRDLSGRKINDAEAIILILMEKILETQLIYKRGKSLINSKFFEISDALYRILYYGGILSKDTWPEKARKIAEIIRDIVLENPKRNFKKILDLASSAFLRDMSDISILLSSVRLSQETEAIDLDDIKSRIIRSAVKSDIDIVKVTPAIEAMGVFQKPKDIVRYWYRERARDKIRIELFHEKRKEHSIGIFPDTWQITDPIESLDVVLSLSSFPKMLPNITTKKWSESKTEIGIKSVSPPDLLMIIDSSGSMGYYTGWIKPKIDRKSLEHKVMKKLGLNYLIGSKFDIAVTAAFAAIEYALNRNAKVAVINFSGKGIVCDWTCDRKKAEDYVMIFQGDGTELPIKKISKLLLGSKKVLVILITDSEIYNERDAIDCLRKIRDDGHMLYIFHIEKERDSAFIRETEKIGNIIHVRNIESLIDIVIGQVKKHYLIT